MMREKPNKKHYKFLCVFRGKRIEEERELSSDEEELNIVPRLLWPEGQSPDEARDNNYIVDAEEQPASTINTYEDDERHHHNDISSPNDISSLNDISSPNDILESEERIPCTPGPKALHQYTPDPQTPLEHTPEPERSLSPELEHTPEPQRECTPESRTPPQRSSHPTTPPRRSLVANGPAEINRGYYSEIVVVDERDIESTVIEAAHTMRNPFIDVPEIKDEKLEEQERRKRYQESRKNLGYVIRGNKFVFPPSIYEDGSPTAVHGPTLLWPRKVSSTSPSPSPSPSPPHSPSPQMQQPVRLGHGGHDLFVPSAYDPGTPVMAPPKITWQRIVSSPGDDFDERSFYFPADYYGDEPESSTYGSETKPSSYAKVYNEHFNTIKEQPLQIKRPGKHSMDDDDYDNCEQHEEDDHTCDSFDGCWGVRKHVVGAYYWAEEARESFEIRIDKLQILRRRR